MEEGSQIEGEPRAEAMAMSRWSLIPRIVIYAAAVVFIISLLVVGRTKPSKTATSPTSAKADLTITKTLSPNTARSGDEATVTLRIRNPGSAQTVNIRDQIFPGFTYVGSVGSSGLTGALSVTFDPPSCTSSPCSVVFGANLTEKNDSIYITYLLRAQ